MDYYTAYGSNSRGPVHAQDEDPVLRGVKIPLTTGEVVVMNEDNLEDSRQVVELLRSNRVKLSVWVNLALLYYRKGRYNDFTYLLNPETQKGAFTDYQSNERDQMRSLDMMAAYYVQKGSQEKSIEARKQWFLEATVLYSAADKIIMYDQNHLLGRAYFCLLEGNKTEQAEVQFKFVLNDDQRGGLAPATDETLTIPAMMGQACIMYMRKEFKLALQIYKKCLQMNPNCPASVRLGIGYCLAKLGKTDKAKIAFTRALQLEPSNVDAAASLAVLQMTHSNDGSEMRQGIQSLAQLYKTAKDHPLILNHLANHFFIKSQLDETTDKESLLMKAKRLLDYAVTVSKNEQMLSESNFHLGRYFHAQGKIHDAHRHYSLAAQQAGPKFKLPSFGYGQTNILLKEYDKAIEEFEKVLKAYPDNSDVLKILGALYARQSEKDNLPQEIVEERRRKAREYLQKAAKNNPDDLEILIDLAVLLQRFDVKEAINTYNKIIEQFKAHDSPVPPEIENNMGVLYFISKKFDKARECFIACREILVSADKFDAKLKGSIVTVTYNLARCDEKLSKFGEAERIYKGILKKRPSYMDAMFRLGCIYYKRGNNNLAINSFKEVMAADPKNVDSWLMWGQILFDQGQLDQARKKFEHVLTSAKTPDPVALVMTGNVYVKHLMKIDRNRKDDETQRDRALRLYHKALRVNPKNVYAMHGAGILFAQKGDLNTAREFFGPVKERISDYPDVWINTANVQLDSSNYQSAIQMYITVIRRFNRRKNPDLLTNIAHAYYKLGKFESALDYLDRALLIQPTNLIHRFNYGLTTLKSCSAILNSQQATESKVKQAVDRLNAVAKALRQIQNMPPEKVQPYRYISRTVCGEIAEKCEDLHRQADVFIGRARKRDIEELERIRDNEVERRRVINEQKRAAKHKEEEETLKLEKLKLHRTFYIQKNKEALKKREIEEDRPKRAGGGSRKRKRPKQEDDFVNDSDDDGRDPMERQEEKRRNAQKASRRNKKKDQAFINDGSSDEEGKKKRRKKKTNEEIEEEDQRKFKGKVKSKAIIESESSSSDSDAPADQHDVPTIRNRDIDSGDSDAESVKKAASSGSESETASPPKKRILTDSDDSDANEGNKSRAKIESDDDSD
ncbi:unnamed protein product [Bursaphelenchus xylophilus]|uniref:(pine wood nematode) hypothetical protein n=1 Tax=Bursaphelenchus xylophilus TaxID=6326 RepID=A0A7I8XDD9_BURXY|nr:unnamed protein product [Bursaphelenchus xylophilus]CAG9131497.1 unnamed protein product [Bursaphelenchus xylophilus]